MYCLIADSTYKILLMKIHPIEHYEEYYDFVPVMIDEIYFSESKWSNKVGNEIKIKPKSILNEQTVLKRLFNLLYVGREF